MAKFPNVTISITTIDGNAFSIIGTATKAMRRAGVAKEDTDAYFAEATSGDYDKVIQTTMKYVNCE